MVPHHLFQLLQQVVDLVLLLRLDDSRARHALVNEDTVARLKECAVALLEALALCVTQIKCIVFENVIAVRMLLLFDILIRLGCARQLLHSDVAAHRVVQLLFVEVSLESAEGEFVLTLAFFDWVGTSKVETALLALQSLAYGALT